MEPGIEFLAAFLEKTGHLMAFQDQETFFIHVLTKKGIEHFVGSFLHHNVDLDDAPVQAVDTLQVEKSVSDDHDGKRHKRHVSQKHFACNAQTGKKPRREKPLKNRVGVRIVHVGRKKTHVSRLTKKNICQQIYGVRGSWSLVLYLGLL